MATPMLGRAMARPRRKEAGNLVRDRRQGGPSAERFLLFESGGEAYAIAAGFLLEVALRDSITALGGAAGGECAAFSHRGFVIPVIDLRALFGLPSRPAGAEDRVLVGEAGGQRFGLMVDRVGDVAEITPRDVLGIPEGASHLPPACFRGVVGREARPILVLEAAGLAALECVQRFGEVLAVPRAAGG